MTLDDRTAQEQLTPEQRRAMLRAFGDRMLLTITAMSDPEDMPGAERAVRVAAVIERLYSRCDRAERCAPNSYKLEAERAHYEREAIKARGRLADTIAWNEHLAQAKAATQDQAKNQIKPQMETPAEIQPQTPAPAAPAPLPGVPTPAVATPDLPMAPVTVTDYTDIIEKALASGLRLRRQDNTAAGPEPPSSV